MAQKLRKHGKKLEKTSVGCDIDFTILLSMLKVKPTKVLYRKNLLTIVQYIYGRSAKSLYCFTNNYILNIASSFMSLIYFQF